MLLALLVERLGRDELVGLRGGVGDLERPEVAARAEAHLAEDRPLARR